jgi:hypothetical protein
MEKFLILCWNLDAKHPTFLNLTFDPRCNRTRSQWPVADEAFLAMTTKIQLTIVPPVTHTAEDPQFIDIRFRHPMFHTVRVYLGEFASNGGLPRHSSTRPQLAHNRQYVRFTGGAYVPLWAENEHHKRRGPTGDNP